MFRQLNRPTDSGLVNLVVAHEMEARPLIKMLNLKLQSNIAFKVYGNEEGVCLIVSGMGKAASAAAVAYIGAIQEGEVNRSSAWLNIGIAGHQTAAVGALLLAGKITDSATGRSTYPVLPQLQLPVTELTTVDNPELNYPENQAYDMEAYGFYSTANRFATAELVQVVKIISDNPHSSVDNINRESIDQWTSVHRNAVQQLVVQLGILSTEYNRIYSLTAEYQHLRSCASFSVTQDVQLRKLYRRYYALGLVDLSEKIDTISGLSAVKILQELEFLIAEVDN